MMVVAEIDDPFVPLPDDLLVNLRDSRAVVEALLDSLPQGYARACQVCRDGAGAGVVGDGDGAGACFWGFVGLETWLLSAQTSLCRECHRSLNRPTARTATCADMPPPPSPLCLPGRWRARWGPRCRPPSWS